MAVHCASGYTATSPAVTVALTAVLLDTKRAARTDQVDAEQRRRPADCARVVQGVVDDDYGDVSGLLFDADADREDIVA